MADSALSLDSRVYVAGHHGLVGSGVWRQLAVEGFADLVGWRSSEVDLRDRTAAFDAILTACPQVIVVAAAKPKVGGILANSTHPVDFLNDNLLIQANLFEAAHAADVSRLLFLGSSCICPELAPQPIPESALLTGPLQPTNDAYAIAKISGIIAIKSYRAQHGRRWISALPTNLYGPGDNFDLTISHVLPAMIRKYHDALASNGPVTLWGTGTPRREFLHVDDLADNGLHLLQVYDSDTPINVGTGVDVTIRELDETAASVVGFTGETVWDTSNPDGTPRRLLDTTRLAALRWTPRIDLREGIKSTYFRYREHVAHEPDRQGEVHSDPGGRGE